MRRFVRRRPWLGVILIGGCHSLVDPPLPPNAQMVSPPEVYSAWWTMTEACSGQSRSLGSVHWYVVPGAATLPLAGADHVSGYWSLASNSIVLAGQSALDGPFVRHEMLHAILQHGQHTRADFVVRCGGVVECIDRCVTDAGLVTTADATIPVIPPAALIVGLDVSPSSPSAVVNDGFFTVTVSATNPLDTPARVSLPDSSRYNLGTTFSYYIQGPFGGRSADVRPKDISAVTFGPHERKVQVFDFRVGFDAAQDMLRPGAYQVGGRFGRRSLPAMTANITLQP